jgi:tRNA wybutosine-synthesizing protein 2
VPRLDAETIRKRLNSKGYVRKDVRIIEQGGYVLLPLTDRVDRSVIDEEGLEIVEGDPRERECYRTPFDIIKERLALPDRLADLLPYKWEMLGDVLIAKFPVELRPAIKRIAETYAAELKAKTVLDERGYIDGVFRTPRMEIVYGTETETIHHEGTILYKLDATKLMFSSGNFDEKKRMGELDCTGETVVDMFAGIGYFTLPLAKMAHAKRVIACEINPLAYSYLQQNIKLNGVEEVVETYLGDNRTLPYENVADRIVMGYIGSTEASLPKAMRLIKKGGIIHYHDVCSIDEIPEKMVDAIAEAAGEKQFEVLQVKEVKAYAPCKSHMVIDVRMHACGPRSTKLSTDPRSYIETHDKDKTS